ncbi:MAG: phenylalanine--tRNA ligase beta subunit-related protein, partial [Deinococcus sp.]|nr:phenylalanine--tRNA ligase beta subunit-related protein [Deinococcus sp.]
DIGEGLVVRRALQGEKLVTLDSLERQLSPEDLLITAKKGGSTTPVGLAGVMGGENSEVHADTTAVALEVAHFNPVGIRLSARRVRGRIVGISCRCAAARNALGRSLERRNRD